MSQSGWYHDKAAECNKMALASANAVTRGRHIKDRDNWREIAARIDAAEEAVKKRKELRPPRLAASFNFVREYKLRATPFKKTCGGWRQGKLKSGIVLEPTTTAVPAAAQ